MRSLTSYQELRATIGHRFAAIAALAALLTFGVGPIEAKAADVLVSCSVSGTFTVSDLAGEVVAKTSSTCSGTAVIPSGVTKIDLFQNNTNLLRIEIPASVTTIASYAFANSRNLAEVVFAANSNLTQIGPYTFANTKLAAFQVPARVTSIGDAAFTGLPTLTALTFEAGSQLQTIGTSAFSGTRLTSVSFPDSLTSLGTESFKNNTTLTSVTFGAGSQLTTIGNDVFVGLPQVTIALPATVTSIGNNPFGSNVRLTLPSSNPSFTLENGVIYNKNKTTLISYAPWLTDSTFVIPGTVTTIGQWAFVDSQLQTLNIPSTVSTLGAYTFARSTRLTEVTFSANSTVTRIPSAAFQASGLLRITIPASVTFIEGYALNTSLLEQVTFAPNSNLQEISNNVFMGARLASIEIPASVHTIGSDAFSSNTLLTSVTFASGSNLRQLGARALGNRLTSLTLPTSPSLSGYRFLGWSNTSNGTIVANAAATVIAGQALFAKWLQLATVTFNSGSGSAVANGSFGAGETVSAPTPPTRTGFTFAGWSLTNGGAAITFPYLPASSANLTLYALWDAVPTVFAVTYNSNSGSAVANGSFGVGETVSAPTPPTRTGFTFAGWALTNGGAAITFPYLPASSANLTLYALWDAVPTVSAGSVADSQVVSIPAGITAAEVPATASLPKVSLAFAATSASASATVVPITNPAVAEATPFAVTGSTKIVDIQVSGITGPVTVCLEGTSTDDIFHFTGGAWVPLPQRTFANGQVCGVTESFSPFAAAAAIPVMQNVTYNGPRISGRSHKVVQTEGGSEFTIFGELLSEVNSVTLDGKVLDLVSKSANEIVFKTLAHAAGFVDLLFRGDSVSLLFQDAFEYRAPAVAPSQITTSKSLAVSSSSTKTLTSSQQKWMRSFVASANAGAVLTCQATYVAKTEAASAKALASDACSNAKKANSNIATKVLAPVAVKSTSMRKILLSLTK